jgi:hypothetical protein
MEWAFFNKGETHTFMPHNKRMQMDVQTAARFARR